MKPQPPHVRLRLPASLLVLACGAQTAHAANDDAIIPDRPSVTASSQVVGQGRVQLEIGANWDRERHEALHVRTLGTPTLLRIGLGDTTELRVETDGRSIARTFEPATGVRSTSTGWQSTAVGLKWHIADGEGQRPSLGLIGSVTLPTGSAALRGKGLLPRLEMAAEWEISDDWSLAITPGVGADVDDGGVRFGYAVLAASLGRKLTERLQGFVELAAPQVASSSHGGAQAQVDVGVSWLLNKNCQVDAMVVRGLNHHTPDLGLAFGLSVRR